MSRWVVLHCLLRMTDRMKTVFRVTLTRISMEKMITQTRLDEEPVLAASSEVEVLTVRLRNLNSSLAVEAMATVSCTSLLSTLGIIVSR